jgi:hypothetical protein
VRWSTDGRDRANGYRFAAKTAEAQAGKAAINKLSDAERDSITSLSATD